MATWARLGAVTTLLAALLACASENPCDEYIDYMCACHDGEDDVTCADYEATYSNADGPLQDECAVALADQEDLDADNGVECAI